MGSKTAKSTQAITVPPEVLARYNAVNSRADTVTNRPFQQYGGEFVAPLSYAQSEGIANTMGAARMAQPYFADATKYLIGAQGDARNYYNNATGQLNQGIEQGNQFAGQSADSLNRAQGVGDQFAGQSVNSLNRAQGVGNQFAGQSADSLNKAQGVGDRFAGQSYSALGEGRGAGKALAGQSLGTLNQGQVIGRYLAGQSYNTLGEAQGIGNELAAQSYGQMGRAQEIGNELASRSYGTLGQAQDVGGQLAGQSLGTINAAQNRADQIQQGVMGNLGAAYSGAQPFNQMAGGQYAQGLGQGQDLTGASSYGTQQALMGAQPFQQIATQFMGSGAQAVNPNELGAEQINKYMSPYLSTVLQGTAGLLNQQNQQQQSGQMGNAIRSGAFGGDRAGIAAANLSQQQNLANSKIFSDILNQGFGQALGTAQQQQQLGLGASQANRAAQQQAAQQALGIGQQGFGQGLAAAQQQGNLGQQFFGMGSTTGQNLAALGQQIYGQGTGTAQAQAALAQQQFGQGATTAAQQAALGEQQFGQGATAAAQQAALGQQQFGQGATAAERLASLGQQQFGQGATVAERQAALGEQQFGQNATAAAQEAALGQQQFGQGATTAAQLASLGQQQFGQGATVAEQQAALGQQQFGQGATVAAQQAALGQQQFGQGATTAAQLASLGQQQFGQGATTAAQQAALGQQQFGQGLAASQQGAAIGRGIYDTGANTAAQTAAMGVSAQDAALSGAAAQMTAGQVDQATRQAENTAKYNQFLQEQSLPYQQLKLASDIALGTGTASGSTTTTSQPGGFFSDERLKENIKAVGKTFDGQTIHSFNYKGDPRTQIGLIAQEVQKHHPDAVGLAGGYKTVNYDKATEDAADRGHMAYGGLASAGGSVLPQDAGQGFASGGVAGFDPAVMQQLLAAQQAMYDPIMKGNMYAGGPNAGGGLVPQSEFVARQMMTPAELPRRATSAEQASTIANLGKTINEFGEDVGAWGDKENDKENNKKKATPFEELTAEELSRSRRKQFAGGGMPYSNQMPGMGLDIPTFEPSAGSNGPMTAGALQARKSGLDKLSQVANVADTGMKLANFGKKIGLFSTGGTPYGGQGLDIPEKDDFSKKYELMTPASLQKQESGLDKVGKIAKIAGTVASIFGSDRRMKENIKEIGKLFDGQVVHSFNYKGDPRTQIGLIAQEVEDHKPHAVGLSGGMKTVDYDKATSGAARRGHFAMGGQPMGAGLMGAGMAGLNEADREPDFNLDPEDIVSGGDPDMEFFMRDSLKKPESPAQAAGLGALENKSAKILNAYRPKAPINPRPTGLAPKASGLPKNISQIARLIRAGEGTGQNPNSTAIGPYQMLNKTFAGQFRQQYPDRARGMSDRDIIALKRSPEGAALSDVMGPKLIESNARVIKRGGFEPDAGNVYLAHFLGPDTAVKVLRANPNAPIANYVSEEAIMANRPLQENPTVGGVIDWARGSMAKQAASLSRASGGLAGRNGYQTAGTVVDEDPDMAFRRSLEEDATNAKDDPEILVQNSTIKPPVLNANLPKVSLPEPKVSLPEPKASLPEPKVSMPAPNTSPRPNIYGVGDQKPVNYEGGRVPNYSYDYMTEPFFRGIKKGKASSIIPLLTGIAAMGTAPTRSLGVALATGVGAGAQSYSGLANERNKQLVQRQIGTARYADSVRALFEREAVPLGGGRYYYRNREINQAEYDQMLSDAINNKSGVMLPQIPATAKTYMPPKPPEPAKPVAVTGKPDTTTTSGILVAAFQDPVVVDARNKAAQGREDIAKLRALQSDPGIIASPNTLQATNSRLAAAETVVADATAVLSDRLSRLTGVPLSDLQASNAARIDVNVNEVERANIDGRKALEIKETIRQMLPNIKDGSALTPFVAKIGQTFINSGMDKDFVKNFINAPDSTQTQAALASQLKSYGDDPEAAAALKLYGSPQFSAAAVRALLRNAEIQADAKISAAKMAVDAFYGNPATANVPKAAFKATQQSYDDANKKQFGEPGARYFKVPPKPGDLKPGTVYYVGNQRFVAK